MKETSFRKHLERILRNMKRRTQVGLRLNRAGRRFGISDRFSSLNKEAGEPLVSQSVAQMPSV